MDTVASAMAGQKQENNGNNEQEIQPLERGLLCAALLAAGRVLSEKELLTLLQTEYENNLDDLQKTAKNLNLNEENSVDEALATSPEQQSSNKINQAYLKKILTSLADTLDKAQLGLEIEHVAGGYRLVVAPQLAPSLAPLLAPRPLPALSHAALETLALVAYKQPITRGELELSRGTSCSSTLDTLQERNLIKIVGQKETIGKPNLYGTTKHFLLEFGLKSLQDLPPIEEAPTDFVRS